MTDASLQEQNKQLVLQNLKLLEQMRRLEESRDDIIGQLRDIRHELAELKAAAK